MKFEQSRLRDTLKVSMFAAILLSLVVALTQSASAEVSNLQVLAAVSTVNDAPVSRSGLISTTSPTVGFAAPVRYVPRGAILDRLTMLVRRGAVEREAGADIVANLALMKLVGHDSPAAHSTMGAHLVLSSAAARRSYGLGIDYSQYRVAVHGEALFVLGPDDAIVVGDDGEANLVESEVLAQYAQPLRPSNTGYVTSPTGSGYSRGGGCPARSKAADWGQLRSCWWKYRMPDNSTSNDYWAYFQATIARPYDLRFRRDAYVKNLSGKSQMRYSDRIRKDGLPASRTENFYKGMFDHAPHTSKSGGKCHSFGLEISRGPATLTSNVAFCDNWTVRVDERNGAMSNKFYTGFFGEAGNDQEVGHAWIAHTKQRSKYIHAPVFYDSQWMELCTGDHFTCKKTEF